MRRSSARTLHPSPKVAPQTEGTIHDNAELECVLDGSLQLSYLELLPAALVGRDFRIRGFSPAAAAPLGLNESSVGRSIEEVEHLLSGSPAEIDWTGWIGKVFETGQESAHDVRDRSGRWYSLRIQPYRNGGSDPGGALLLLIDIDDSKKSEERAAYMAAIVMWSDDAIISKDLNGIIHSWNRAAERLYGYTQEEAIGNPVAMLIPPEHLEEEPEILRRIRSGEMIDHYETVRIHKDGRLIDVSITVSPVKDPSGQIVGAAKIARDITQLKRSQEALRESEERFRTVADHAPVLIWVSNSAGLCEFANKTYLDFLGTSLQDVQDDGWAKYIHPDDATSYIAGFHEARERRRKFESEFRFLRHDGDYRWMKTVGAPLISHGEFVGFIGSTVDITDRKQDELRILQAQKLESMGVLAGGIAHDFNNLLTGILGASDILANLEGMPDRAKPLLNGVATACMRASDLTRQILAYAGKGRFLIEPVDVSALSIEIIELLRASIPKNVLLNTTLSDDSTYVMGDRGQLQQVIMNIILNAAESLEGKPGQVWVSTSVEELDAAMLQAANAPAEAEPGAYLMFRVRDEGVGMDEATLAKSFDPFFSTKSTGRGLGLSAVLGIVRGHNGALSVKSTPKKGTTFEVLLPMISNLNVGHGAPGNQRKPSNGSRSGAVLVVDDESIVRTIVQNALETEGLAVFAAANGLEGVQLFEKEKKVIICVVLDLTMPVMNGDEALKRIREISPDVPVIVMSGFSETEASSRFGDDDQLVFLQKPFSVADLTQKLDVVMSWSD